MLLQDRNLQAWVHWCDGLSINSAALDLDEELCESDSKQCHGEFDKETSAEMQITVLSSIA